MYRHITAAALCLVTAACAGDTTPKTAALETSADALQTDGPIGKISMHLVGFHPAKDDPMMQMESHHFCNQLTEDLAQCVLYDGDGDEARLHGIEFIISEKLYTTLPEEERLYWHPHNYEILSGTLRLPRVPDVAEKAALADKMNSYGKTWHVWKTGVFGEPADALPLGPAHLAWSFNFDGEAKPGMIEARDKRMGLDTAAARADRADLSRFARPQGGVSALQGPTPHATGTLPGVVDNGDAKTHPVPRVVVR